MVGVVGIYLLDSSLLLYSNEGIVSPSWGGNWSVSLSSGQFQLKGKDVFVPNPFFPHQPLFRLHWSVPCTQTSEVCDLGQRKALFRPLAPIVWGIAVALFVLLPLGLFSRLGEQMLLTAVLFLYLCIGTALVWIGINRSEFGLSTKRFVAIAFESLVCSPIALNIIRKISREMLIDDDLVVTARRLQTPDHWIESRTSILAKLDSEIEQEDEDSERAGVLLRYKNELAMEQA